MPRSNWGFIVAAVIGLVAFASILGGFLGAYASYQPGSYPHADQHAYEASPPDRDWAAYPVENAAACYQAKTHDQADLCAQWRAAFAAEYAADAAHTNNLISIFGVALSSIGLVALVFTIQQGRLALERAAEANKIARDEFRQGHKPMLHVTPLGQMSPDDRFPIPDVGESMVVHFRAAASIKNIGQGVAVIDYFEIRMLPHRNFVTTTLNRVLEVGAETFLASAGNIASYESDKPMPHVASPHDDGLSWVKIPYAMYSLTRREAIMTKPPFVGRIGYTDPLGIKRIRGFAFEPSSARSGDFTECGGPACNYDRIISDAD